MSFHDDYLRRTPLDVLFPEPDSAEEWLGELLSADADVTALDLAGFLGLAPVRSLMDRLLSTESDGAAESPLGTLSFFAFHALLAGDVRLAEIGPVRAQIEGADESAEPRSPERAAGAAPDWLTGAGYVQLPRNLAWTTPESGLRPEPVDGFFWYVPDQEVVSLLIVSGLIPGRPEMHVTLVQDAPLTDALIWEQHSMRDGGPDFASTLPGGDQLYSLVNLGEALKLAGRLLRLPTAEPSGAAEPVSAPESDAARGAGAPSGHADPTRSWLVYRVIRTS